MGGMADEGGADTFEYPINGRTLTLRRVSPARVLMLNRYVQTMQRRGLDAGDDGAAIVALGRKISDAVWELVESQFVNLDDLEFVQKEIINGRLEEHDLIPLLTNGHKDTTPDDDADPAPPKKRISKAAKKAANPTRAKR